MVNHPSNSLEHRRSEGFTLIELMVVIAVVAVVATIAAPSFRSYILLQQLKNTGYDMVSSLMRARSEAMTQNVSVNVTPNDGVNWQSGWKVATATATLSQYAAFSGLTVACKTGGAAVATCPAITYNSYGRVAAPTSPPTIQISIPGNANIRCVSLDLSGLPKSAKTACP